MSNKNFFKGGFFENLLESSSLQPDLRSYMSEFGIEEIEKWTESVQEELLIRKLKENLWGVHNLNMGLMNLRSKAAQNPQSI